MNYEDQLQIAVAQYCDLKKWRWCHVANERNTSPRRGAMLKKKGVKRGVPDVLIFEDWKTPDDEFTAMGYGPIADGFGIAIELKAPKRYPTPEQREWLADLKARGWLTGIVHTLDEFIALTECIG